MRFCQLLNILVNFYPCLGLYFIQLYMYVSAKIYQIEASVFHHLQMKVPPSWKYCWNNLWWWGFLFTFTAVLDDLPAPGGLQGLPDLRANLPVAAGVLYGLVCPFSPKISKETKVFWRWQKLSYKDGDIFRNPPAPPPPCICGRCRRVIKLAITTLNLKTPLSFCNQSLIDKQGSLPSPSYPVKRIAASVPPPTPESLLWAIWWRPSARSSEASFVISMLFCCITNCYRVYTCL